MFYQSLFLLLSLLLTSPHAAAQSDGLSQFLIGHGYLSYAKYLNSSGILAQISGRTDITLILYPEHSWDLLDNHFQVEGASAAFQNATINNLIRWDILTTRHDDFSDLNPGDILPTLLRPATVATISSNASTNDPLQIALNLTEIIPANALDNLNTPLYQQYEAIGPNNTVLLNSGDLFTTSITRLTSGSMSLPAIWTFVDGTAGAKVPSAIAFTCLEVQANDFLGAMIQSGLTYRFENLPNSTYFIPHDQAFAQIAGGPAGLNTLSPQALANLLETHVVPGPPLLRRDIDARIGQQSVAYVTALNGRTISLERGDNGGFFVDSAFIVSEYDIPMSNGVAHIIDEVLVPTVSDYVVPIHATSGLPMLASLVSVAAFQSAARVPAGTVYYPEPFVAAATASVSSVQSSSSTARTSATASPTVSGATTSLGASASLHSPTGTASTAVLSPSPAMTPSATPSKAGATVSLGSYAAVTHVFWCAMGSLSWFLA